MDTARIESCIMRVSKFFSSQAKQVDYFYTQGKDTRGSKVFPPIDQVYLDVVLNTKIRIESTGKINANYNMIQSAKVAASALKQ